jgi:hypothetical protein
MNSKIFGNSHFPYKYHVQLENGTKSGPPEIESVAPGASAKPIFADQSHVTIRPIVTPVPPVLCGFLNSIFRLGVAYMVARGLVMKPID